MINTRGSEKSSVVTFQLEIIGRKKDSKVGTLKVHFFSRGIHPTPIL